MMDADGSTVTKMHEEEMVSEEREKQERLEQKREFISRRGVSHACEKLPSLGTRGRKK